MPTRPDALTPRAREFFRRIERAVAANPFGEERARIDRQIVGRSDLPRAEFDETLMSSLEAQLRELGHIHLDRFTREDRDLVEAALLFKVFHRTAAAFDSCIERELRGERASMPFARDTIQYLVAAGWSEHEARHHFSIMWQLRRAYWFVERSLPGSSSSMGRVRQSLWNNVFTQDLRLYVRTMWRRMEDFSTFLVGETGTGKGTAAAAIGRSGWIGYDAKKQRFEPSFVDAFVSVNLAEFAASLVESELFGHKRGAFTGAVADYDGVFARSAAHGSIFLDEIAEVDKSIQVKLLTVLQERHYRPVGSTQSNRFEGRVIAATNRPLHELRTGGSFRDDLWYRLSADVIRMPSLRTRLDEAPSELDELLVSILQTILGESKSELLEMVREVIRRDVGEEYAWPGNVRELTQCVRRILLTQRYEPELGPAASSRPALLEATAGRYTAEELLSHYCAALYAELGTYEAVAARVQLDRRTVKRHVSLVLQMQ